MRHRFGSLWSPRQAGALLAACFLALGSLAEDAADAGADRGAVIEEVVVTAQKRAENLQDVPVAVTALTSEDLDVARLRNINELAGHW